MNSTKRRYANIQELISLPTLSDVQISNNGNNIAFVKNIAHWDNNVYRSHLWVYIENKKELFELTSNNIDVSNPSWSPDSTHIAYLCTVDDNDGIKNQIFVMSITDHKSIQVTYEKEGVSSFKWAPDSNGFYYVSQVTQYDKIKKRCEKYGNFEHIGKDIQNNCLYYTDSTENKSRYQLTDSDKFIIEEFNISNDGKKIAFIAATSPNYNYWKDRDIYLLNTDSKELKKMNIDKLLHYNICFSPNSDKLCYTATLREKDYYITHIEDNTIYIYDINSDSTIIPLNDFESTITPIKWTDEGILIMWQSKTNFIIGLLSQDTHIKMLSDKIDCVIIDASITQDGKHVSYIKAKPNEIFEVYLDHKKLTDENSYLDNFLKSNRQIISWKCNDNIKMEGILTTPVDFNANHKYPLLVLVHGGPAFASFPIHSSCFNERYPVEQFIEKGFIVLEPNYRGSSGYGNDFLKLNYRKIGVCDYNDIMSAIDYLTDIGIIDKYNVGIMGWSNGGYISSFCSTYSNSFKAVSVGGGVSDWITNYVNTSTPQDDLMYLGATPWNDPQMYAKASPITYIKSARTPTLIQHGEDDSGVSVVNAYELYKGLKDMNVETELIIFKDMGYSSNNPKTYKTIMLQNLMWFSHYMLGENLENDNITENIPYVQ